MIAVSVNPFGQLLHNTKIRKYLEPETNGIDLSKIVCGKLEDNTIRPGERQDR